MPAEVVTPSPGGITGETPATGRGCSCSYRPSFSESLPTRPHTGHVDLKCEGWPACSEMRHPDPSPKDSLPASRSFPDLPPLTRAASPKVPLPRAAFLRPGSPAGL